MGTNFQSAGGGSSTIPGGSFLLGGGGMTNPTRQKTQYTEPQLIPLATSLTGLNNGQSVLTQAFYNYEGLNTVHVYVEIDTPITGVGIPSPSSSGTVMVELIPFDTTVTTGYEYGTNYWANYTVNKAGANYMLYFQVENAPPVWTLRITNNTGTVIGYRESTSPITMSGAKFTEATDFYYTPRGGFTLGGNAAREQVQPTGGLVFGGTAPVTTSQGSFSYLARPDNPAKADG